MKLFPFFNKVNNKTGFKCDCCGVTYDEIPFCFGNDKPDYYYSIPNEERDKRIELKESLCVVDKKHFFHRGRLIIPITDYKEDLIFNVWTSISEDNFCERMDFWDDGNRINNGPYFGWLQTNVPSYGDTINIKTIAIENGLGIIPHIKITEENHPLKFDQEFGISYEKALRIVNEILRKEHQNNNS